LALMALLLALATNIGVGTMVASFRQTFVGWLDQRLASELYVTARTEAEGEEIVAYLKNRADAVLPIWHVEGEAAGQPVEIFGVADHQTYRDKWPLIEALPGVWDEVAAGRGLLINEQLWRRSKLALGAALLLPGGLSLPIVGVYSDYGNPIGQVTIGIDQLTAHYPDVQRLRFGIRVQPSLASALANDLRDTFALPPENVRPQAEIKAFSLQVFERTFTVTAALDVLTLGIATIAIFASLLTLANMRLPSVAPVWAMGVTMRTLAQLDLARSLILAALTLLVAIPLGIALAWALLAIVNVEAFGWRLPLRLFPGDWAWLGVMALAAATVAAALPAWSLARMSPSRLTKVFSNER
jgi:putative ABC transport system permease protein